MIPQVSANDAFVEKIIRKPSDFTDISTFNELQVACNRVLLLADIQDATFQYRPDALHIMFQRHLDREHFTALEDFNFEEGIIMEVYSRSKAKQTRQMNKIATAFKQAAAQSGLHRAIEIDPMPDENSVIIEAKDKGSYFMVWRYLPTIRKATLEALPT